MKRFVKTSIFYTIKLPLIFFLITIGFLMDFIIHLPFTAICTFENMVRKRLSQHDS